MPAAVSDAPPTANEIVRQAYIAKCTGANAKPNSGVLALLERNVALRELNLSNNFVGDKGCQAILEVFRRHPTITELNLSNNGLTDAIVPEIFEACQAHLGLTSLDLGHNPITQDAGKKLLELAQRNRNILALDVSGTDIFDALAQRIALSVEENRKSTAVAPQLKKLGAGPQQKATPGVAASRPNSLFANPEKWQSYVTQREAKHSGTGIVLKAERALLPSEQRADASVNQRHQQELERGRVVDISMNTAPTIELRRLREEQRTLEEQEKSQEPVELSSGLARQTHEERWQAHLELMQQELALSPSGPATMASNIEDTALSATAVEEDPLDWDRIRQDEFERLAAGTKRGLVQAAQTEHGDLKKHQEVLKRQAASSPHKMETKFAEPPRFTANEGPDAPAAPPPTVPAPATTTPRATTPRTVTAVQTPRMRATPAPQAPINVTGEAQVTFATDGSEEAKKFKDLFDAAGAHYTSQRFEEAHKLWTEALEFARQCNRRDWVTVVQSNIHNISFQLLIQQGDQNVKTRDWDQALQCFRLATDVAQRARKPLWQETAEGRIVTTRLEQLQQLHTKGQQLFDQLVEVRQQQTQHANVQSPESEGTSAPLFAMEWGRLGLLQELIECWVDSYALLDQLPPSGEQEQWQAALIESVDVLFEYQYRITCSPANDRRPSQPGLPCIDFPTPERERLLQWWKGANSVIQSLRDARWRTLGAMMEGLLHFTLFHNKDAILGLQRALELSKSSSVELQALARTLLGNTMLQNRRLREAEQLLLEAIAQWDGLRAEFGAREDHIAPKPFVIEQQAHAMTWLQQSYVGQGRFREALEAAERCKLVAHGDRLLDKIRANYGSSIAAEQLYAVARKHDTVFVVYSLVYELDWSDELNEMLSLEVLYAWVVPREGEVKFAQVKVTAEYSVPSLVTLVQEAREALGILPHAADAADGVVTSAPEVTYPWQAPLKHLFDFLVFPVLDFLTASSGFGPDTRLTIVPESFLWLVPWAALLDSNGEYFVQRFVLTYSGSIQLLAFNELSALRVTSRKAVTMFTNAAVGVPTLHPDATPPLSADPSNLDAVCENLDRLPHVFQRDTATLTNLLPLLCDKHIVHIGLPVLAGVRSRGVWGALAVAPADESDPGVLYSSDIQLLDNCCDIVVLTNANMNRQAALLGGDGVVEITRALMSSGVPAVLSTAWATPDYVAADFLAPFYRKVRETKGDIAQLLAQCTRELVADQPFNPRLWAPYMYFGKAVEHL